MIVAGSPFLENIVVKIFTVCVDIVVVILTTYGHFEWESTIIKNPPKKGPANLTELFPVALLAIPMHSVMPPLVRFDSADILNIS